MKKSIATIFIIIMLFSSGIFSQEKTSIAVWDFEAMGLSDQEVDILSRRVISLLVSTDRYIVTDRNNMKAILDEQSFQLSGCTSSECIVEIGQLLGVQKMLSGSIGKFGSMFTIEMYIIDMQTGQIEKSANYDVQGQMELLLTKGIGTALDILLGKIQAESVTTGKGTVVSTIDEDDIKGDIVNRSEDNKVLSDKNNLENNFKKIRFHSMFDAITDCSNGIKFGIDYFPGRKLNINLRFGYDVTSEDGAPVLFDAGILYRVHRYIRIGVIYKYAEEVFDESYYEDGDREKMGQEYGITAGITPVVQFQFRHFYSEIGLSFGNEWNIDYEDSNNDFDDAYLMPTIGFGYQF